MPPRAAPPPPMEVEAVLRAAPEPARRTLTELRDLVFATAAETEGVGALVETLRWGEPTYLTKAPKSGSTLRLGWKPTRPETCALLVHCQTSLADAFRARHPGTFEIEGRRALLLPAGAPLPEAALRDCIALALTYHRWRKTGPPPVALPDALAQP